MSISRPPLAELLVSASPARFWLAIGATGSSFLAALFVVFGPPIPLSVVVPLLVLLAACVAAWRLHGTLASPLGLFAVLWEGGLALANLRLVGYTPISPEANLWLNGSFVMFALGCLAWGPARRGGYEAPDLGWIGNLFAAGALGGLVLGITRLNSTLGVLAVLNAPNSLRAARVAGGFTSGLTSYLLLLFFPAALLLPSGSKRSIALLVLAAGWSMISSDRSFVALVALFLLIGWLYRKRRPIRPRQVLAAVALVLVSLAVFMSEARLLGKQTQLDTIVTESTGGDLPAAISSPYVYVTGGFVAFSVYTEQTPSPDQGLTAIVTPLQRLFGQKQDVFYPFLDIPFPFNVYTYLRSFYDAFGTPAVWFGPLIVGLLTGFAYARRRASWFWYSTACTLTVGMLGGLLNPYLTYISFYFIFAICCCVPLLVAGRRTFQERGASGAPASGEVLRIVA